MNRTSSTVRYFVNPCIQRSSVRVPQLQKLVNYDLNTKTAAISWRQIVDIHVVTPSTLYLRIDTAGDSTDMSGLELIVGPCPANALGSLIVERRALFGYRDRLSSLVSLGGSPVHGPDHPALALIRDLESAISACDTLVHDLEKHDRAGRPPVA